MKSKKQFEMNEAMLNKIISVAYADASLKEIIEVMFASFRHKEVRSILYSYRSTAGEVKQLGEEEIPHELIKEIELKTMPVKEIKNKFAFDLLFIIFSKPLASAVTSVILIATVIVSLVINKPVQYNYNYSSAEVTMAEKQAKYALDLVSKYFNETHSTLKKEILGDAVAKPFVHSAGIVNNLLKGDKNETN